mmetsp:Transcript_127004/g.355718  ORF Transcript_127004/g.355718 Transcript_127004/m.355718 type:complete len:400 (-) Transcript_127004:337-1536(-)
MDTLGGEVPVDRHEVHLVLGEVLLQHSHARLGRVVTRLWLVHDVGVDHHLRVLVHEGARGANAERLHRGPWHAAVLHLLSGPALQVDNDQALRREERHVAAALEGHLNMLAVLQDGRRGVELRVELLLIDLPLVVAGPLEQRRAARVHFARGADGRRCCLDGVVAKDHVGDESVHSHEVGLVLPEVLPDDAHLRDARPEEDLRVPVEHAAGGLHPECADALPEHAPVGDLLPRPAPDVDDEDALRGEERGVAADLEGELHLLVRVEDLRVALQALLELGRTDLVSVVPQVVQQGPGRRHLLGGLRGVDGLASDLGHHPRGHHARGEQLAIEVPLHCEDVALVLHEAHLEVPHAGRPDLQLGAYVQHLPTSLDLEGLDGLVWHAHALHSLPGEAALVSEE